MRQSGGKVPEAIITDTGSYSDIVFGLLHLLGRRYRPQLANLPDQRLWRIDPAADYGPLDKAARGRIDIERIGLGGQVPDRDLHPHRGSGRARGHAHDSRDGQPTSLGHAMAHFGRIFKTLHVPRLADDEPYRREVKAQANLTEGRDESWRGGSSTAARVR
ncbi:Tn3 family transposase [Nocardia sp. NPDC049190]|uniref:Tn3 family transposase n=1 Tax=Nocardia sp. NPDC049190 TaxID=3155650 RepID=UPI0033DA65A8